MGAQLGRRQVLLEALPLGASAAIRMTAGLGPSLAARRNPDHSISIVPAEETWVARLGSLELARSDRALLLAEAGYPAVVYFPPGDVHTAELIPSDTHTHCPFKGDASYWAANVGDEVADVAWYYPRTFDEVIAIAGYVAFYVNKVTVTRASQSGN
ncbi:MAG: DUF427 domain-containing protein [Woeseiaceae bacterium]|nr:DUF427 domain-containing protein [Woeseiaceae bacterium]